MGTGRSGLSKGEYVKDAKSLRKYAKGLGYALKEHMNIYLDDYTGPYIKKYFDYLRNFYTAMGVSKEVIQNSGGSLDIELLKRKTLGDTNADAETRLNALWVDDEDKMADTLPHEATHNMVHYLITKELGYAKGSIYYNAAYTDGKIEDTIQNAALDDYKDYLRSQYRKNIELAIDQRNRFSQNPNSKSYKLAEDMITSFKQQYKNVDNITIEQAIKNSGMRSYATKQYDWVPKGIYIEIPTVATEVFHQSGYNWDTLKANHPYAYFVLRNLQYRLNK